MRSKHLQSLVIGVAFGMASCSGADDSPAGAPGAAGGGGAAQNPGSGGSSAPGTGGTAATGNTDATGGIRAIGGSGSGNVGNTATGGTATGGAAAGGKAATGGTGITSNCADAQKTLTNNGSGQHCGYTYEYWKDSGTGSLVLKADGFSVDWTNIGNLLGRKGIRPGSANLVVNYDAVVYQPNGNSYLCVYGWTRNPLVEYYIVDSWGDWRPPGGASLGTVTTDGGTYDIYKTERVNQPSIDGTKTFNQYWSVRSTKRTSGTITVGNHFTAWASKGLNMGSFYEVSMTVEGYQSSGKADVKMSIK